MRTLGRMAVDEFDSAGTLLAESLHLERELGSAAGVAWSLNYLGLLAHFAGGQPRARTLLEQSLPMHRALEDLLGYGGQAGLFGVRRLRARRPFASRVDTESLAICRAQGYLWCVLYLFDLPGALAVANGDAVRGARLAGAANALHETVGAAAPTRLAAASGSAARSSAPRSAVSRSTRHGTPGRPTLDRAAAEIRPGARWPRVRVSRCRGANAGTPLETRYAKSSDVSIAYQVVGEGPLDLVFVKGWIPTWSYFWEEPRFALLAAAAPCSGLSSSTSAAPDCPPRPLELPTLEQRMDDGVP